MNISINLNHFKRINCEKKLNCIIKLMFTLFFFFFVIFSKLFDCYLKIQQSFKKIFLFLKHQDACDQKHQDACTDMISSFFLFNKQYKYNNILFIFKLIGMLLQKVCTYI